MPIKDKERAKVYQRQWIARKRQALKKENVEPVEPQYYQANSIKVLLSLKDYTELSKEKHKLWTNFRLTFEDLSTGVGDIIQIMKLKETAEILITDYWKTAKSQERKLTNSWNSLAEKQQQCLINYWAKEKLRKDNNLLTSLEEQEQQAQTYEKELELTKFHEERGKIKCNCWKCAEQKEFLKHEKSQLFTTNEENNKEQCPECEHWVKELDEDNGICLKCLKNYE